MSRPLDPSTPLSVLRRIIEASSRPADITQLVRNVEQSLRVEGYRVSEADVRASAARVLHLDRNQSR